MSIKMKKYTWMLLVMAFAFILSACAGGASAEPTQDPDTVFTQVAETVAVSTTQTAEAAPPTPTAKPTATQLPALPPTATVNPNQPTATPAQPLGPTPTIQLYGDAARWVSQNPLDGKIFDKHFGFVLNVCLVDVGSTDWTTKYYLEWVNGQKLWWETSKFYITDLVKPGEKYCFDIPCISPQTGGEYITRWYFKNEADEKFYEVYFHYFVTQ